MPLYGREADRDLRSACVVDASRGFIFLFFSERAVWGVGGGMLPDFFYCSFFPVQQTTRSGIGHRVK